MSARLACEWRLFLVAVQFLTRCPVPSFPDFDVRWLSQSLRYFPVVGVVIAIVQWLVWLMLASVLPHAVAIVWVMGIGLLMTGGFHEDGWADVCDGFGGAYERERVLTIMKDSRVGAFGAMGLVWMLLAKWSTLSFMGQPAVLLLALVFAHALSRLWAIALIVKLEHVGDAAHSKSKPLGNQMSAAQWRVASLLAMTLCLGTALAAVLLPGNFQGRWMVVGLTLCLSLLTGWLISAACGAWFRRRIGGYTGDCLGATQQLVEVGIYAVVLATLSAPQLQSGAF